MIPILQLTYRKSPELQERQSRCLPVLALILGSILFAQITCLVLWFCLHQ